MRQILADYEQPAQPMAWDELENAVAKRSHRPAIVPLWARRAAAIVGVLMLTGAAYWMLSTQQQPAETAVTQPVPSPRSHDNPAASTGSAATPSEPSLLASTAIHHPSTSSPSVEHVAVPQQQTAAVSQPSPAAAKPEEAPSTTQEAPEAPPQKAPDAQQQPSPAPAAQQYPSTIATPRHQSLALKLTARLFMSNQLTGSTDMATIHGGSYYDTTSNAPDIDAKHNQTQTSHHHPPIRMGALVRIPLSSRWSLETGLAYTQLNSDITTKTPTSTDEAKQRLHYVGIPLNAVYTLWESQRLHVYLSAGGMAEKMVKGSYGDERVSIKPLQFSVNGAAGVEYRLTTNVGLYAEPGVGYSFDNGSQVTTYYQDKPLNSHLSVGIHLTP